MTTLPVQIPCGSLILEGALHEVGSSSPGPAAVVCHPHPLYGGDMDNNVVVAVAEALAGAGIVALRFNFRGTGGSGGAFGGGAAEREDVDAALAFLAGQRGVDGDRLGLVGYSFGALVALGASPGAARALVAVSPPLALAELPVRLPDCPILLVTGGRDDIAPAASLRALAESARDRCEAVVLPGADHFWWGQEGRLAEEVLRFLKDNL